MRAFRNGACQLTWALLAVFIVLGGCLPAQAVEKILNYDSLLEVLENGDLRVTETIKVNAEGKKIRRGIYRDFPTRYDTPNGKRNIKSFEVISVNRDGSPEPYHVEGMENGKRVYIGDTDTQLRPGVYTYVLKYITSRQLGFFEKHDELYWNAIGTGWIFPIQDGSAVVDLPGDLEKQIHITEAYTGPQGAKEQNFKISRDSSGRPVFTLTQELDPNEGFTIVAGWPKGLIPEPSQQQKLIWFLLDNMLTILALPSLGLILLYYLSTWYIVGRDPKPGTIIPLFSPPQNLSPSTMRYIRRMGFDKKSATAAIINMAVKGCLRVEKEGDYTLRKTGTFLSNLSPEEAGFYRELFHGSDAITLSQDNYQQLQTALDALRQHLNTQYEKKYFVLNTGLFVGGALLSILVLVALTILSGLEAEPLFMSIWLGGWTIGVFVLLNAAWAHIWRLFRGQWDAMFPAIGASLFALPFLAGEVAGIYFMGELSSPMFIGVIILVAFVNVLFYHLLKARTITGQKLLDQIEGFRQYLMVAEKLPLQAGHPPTKTPELFERYLPYALALDVENQWAQNFADVLAAAAEGSDQTYTPVWYSGHGFNTHHLGRELNSFTNRFDGAIASASTPPSSSSGSGGGGSSGGGGGGGGGGGW